MRDMYSLVKTNREFTTTTENFSQDSKDEGITVIPSQIQDLTKS